MRIHSVNIGRPQIMMRMGQQFSSAINRKPVDGPIEMTDEGVFGDRVADSGRTASEHPVGQVGQGSRLGRFAVVRPEDQ